jgi:phosphodiesterase/alkaline phosphatase D-like protein
MKYLFFSLLFSISIYAQVELGPFVGAVDETSAVFIIKLDKNDKVSIQLFRENEEKTTFSTAPVTPGEGDYNYAKINVGGLQPDTRYFYRAVVNDKPIERVHSFRTFPEDKRRSFSFGFGSCQQSFFNKSNPVIFPVIAQDTISFFVHLGDWTYPDTTERKYGYRFNAKFDLLELSYQSKYSYDYPFGEKVLSKMPVMYVYDDHDYAANNPDGTDPNKHNTLNAYKKFFPHYELANPDNGIWQSFRYGDAEFFMLDLRSQRRPNLDAFDSEKRFNPPKGHSILAGFEIDGTNQKDWLLNSLKDSDAKWKVIVSSVIFNTGYNHVLRNDTIVKMFEWIAADAVDKWGGFPEDVEAVVNTITENNIKNVFIISGDTHSSYIDDGANSIIPEISASNLDVYNTNLNVKLNTAGIRIWNKGSYDGNGYAYGRVTFVYDEKDYALLEIVDDQGRVAVSHTIYAE